MKPGLESKFNFRISGWLLPFALIFLVPFILLIKKISEGFYYWEQVGYYLIIPVFTCLGLWVGLRYLLQLTPKITIYPDHLEINGDRILFYQIAKIRLFAKSMVVSDCSTIILKNGTEYKLGISLYSNGPLIRKNLKTIKGNLENPESPILLTYQITPIQQYRIKDFKNFKVYKQSIFRSLHTYVVWPVIGMFFYLFITKPQLATFFLFLFFLLLLGLVLVLQNYYFLLSKEYLTIKNVYLPGWQKTFKQSDIVKTTYFPASSRNAAGLKFTFSNFTTKSYRSYLLNDKMFTYLKANIFHNLSN